MRNSGELMENSGELSEVLNEGLRGTHGELRNSGNSDYPSWRTQGGTQEAPPLGLDHREHFCSAIAIGVRCALATTTIARKGLYRVPCTPMYISKRVCKEYVGSAFAHEHA